MKTRKTIYAVIIFVLLVAVGIKVLAWQGKKAFSALTEKNLRVFDDKNHRTGSRLYEDRDVTSLPEVVQRYLKSAIPAEGRRIKNVKITQRGHIRVHDDAAFKPFSAVQYVSANPPQMIWAGNAEHWPLTELSILTAWIEERGQTKAYLWGLLPAFENRGLEMKAYLMVRWLGEAVWYPTALLPSDRISWEAMASTQSEVSRARVRFTDGNMTVSGIFTFMKSSGAPFLFTVEEGGVSALNIYRWYCTYSKWSRVGGYQIPKEITEGVIHGGLQDRRLEVAVTGIEFAY